MILAVVSKHGKNEQLPRTSTWILIHSHSSLPTALKSLAMGITLLGSWSTASSQQLTLTHSSLLRLL